MARNPITLGERLGAEPEQALQCFTIYIPNKNRHSEEIQEIGLWIDTAMQLMAELNGGVTRTDWGEGVWLEDNGQPIKEDTTLVYSFLRTPDVWEARFSEIRTFLHKFGRDTDQAAVMVAFSGEDPDDGTFYSRTYVITDYDPPVPGGRVAT